LGEQGLWTKKTCFELGTRVPLIIAAPHIAASHGKRVLHMAELVDVCEFCALRRRPQSAY
jgi:arylsulfatase A-like enzyme